MERLIYVPIENLPERYSGQWDDWFRAAFKREGIEYIPVGHQMHQEINTGQFLDVGGTLEYKTHQMGQILKLLTSSMVQSTTVFFMDAWFPGIESLAYFRDGCGYPLTIKGMLHAGTYDPNDFLYQKKMGRWGRDFERMLLTIVDEMFIATQYHGELLQKAGLPVGNLSLVEWPIEEDFITREKKDLVVFPHRLAPEKAPQDFEVIRKIFEMKYDMKANWIRTKDICKSKQEYYSMLEYAKVAVSTAHQETYGIAMAEAVNAGCVAVAPKRLSYPEILSGHGRLYENLEQAADFIYDALKNYAPLEKIKGKEISWVNQIVSR